MEKDWLYDIQDKMAELLALSEKPNPTKEDKDRWFDRLLEDEDENLVIKFERFMDEICFDKN